MSDNTQADGVTPYATADVVTNGTGGRFTPHTTGRLRWAGGLATAILLLVAVITVLTTTSHGDPSTSATPPAVTPGDPATTAPATTERPQPTNTPTRDSAHPFVGKDPIPHADPERLMHDFSATYGLSFDTLTNPSGTIRIALKVDQTTTRAIQVTMGIDLDNNLREIVCLAGAKVVEPFSDTLRQFLLDCASRAAGPAADAVRAWLDNAITRRIGADSETDRHVMGATVSGLTLELSYNNLFLTFRIYVPTP